MKKSVLPSPSFTDLRGITRGSKRCLTVVTIYLDWVKKVEWLRFGQAQIRRQGERSPGCFCLEARMTAGVTDFEHDSAYALRLPLVGAQFSELFVAYHTIHLVAWVDPNDDHGDYFRVPFPGYDPTKHEKAYRCKDNRCLEDYPKGHVIVPEGFYVPPFDPDLYAVVRGKKIEITIGPVHEED